MKFLGVDSNSINIPLATTITNNDIEDISIALLAKALSYRNLPPIKGKWTCFLLLKG